jgi:hypothetical protein
MADTMPSEILALMRCILISLAFLIPVVSPAEIHIDSPKSGIVETTSPKIQGSSSGIKKPMWYEVRHGKADGPVVAFGAFPASTDWFVTVRHLRSGENHVSILGSNEKGDTVRDSVVLTLPGPMESTIDPRPRPAEIWWGGLGRNEQLIEASRPWDFVKEHADGFFFHGAYWNHKAIQRLGPGLAEQLAPFTPKYAAELGGQQFSVYDEPSTAIHYRTNIGLILAFAENGIFLTELSHDYGIDFERPAVHVLDNINPDAREKEILDYSVETLWGDNYFEKIFAEFPQIKPAQTTSPAWRWFDNFPPCWWDEDDYSSTTRYTEGVYFPLHRHRHWLDQDNPKKSPYLQNGEPVNLKFNLREVIGRFIDWSTTLPKNGTFAFYNDYPYTHMTLGGKDSARGMRARAMLRAIESFLHEKGAIHTFVCNELVPNKPKDLEKAHRDYAEKSLQSMMLHQIEGGRADRYLFESWYFIVMQEDGKEVRSPFPVWVAPESQRYSYTWLVKQAIRYLKGLDDDGKPLLLPASMQETSDHVVIQVTNSHDTPCLPAFTLQDDAGRSATDASGTPIDKALRCAEGWTPPAVLQPGGSLELRFEKSTSKNRRLRVFWNPQDPTGLVRGEASDF